jgi:glycosyltransferase involved in cell wall biosynthesis
VNRLKLRNLAGLTPDKLPPPRRQDRIRVLFLYPYWSGFSTFADLRRSWCDTCDELDATHIEVEGTRLTKLASRPLGLRWLEPIEFSNYRRRSAFERQLGHWFDGPLPLHRFDVVHVDTSNFAGALARRRPTGAFKLILNSDITLPGGYRLAHGDRRGHLSHRIATAWERKVYAQADLATGTSRWVTESLVNDLGVDPSRIDLMPFAVREPTTSTLAFRREVDGLVRILFVGNDHVRKGLPRLLQWHQQRWADRAELHVVSGQAQSEPARNVVWHGSVKNDRIVNELMPACDLFVLPTFNDLSPVVLAEAARMGLPSVSTRMAGIPELVEEGRTGLLLDVDDNAGFVRAIESLMDDAPLRHSMGEAAHKRALATHHIDAIMGRLLRHLRQLTAT